MLKSKGGPARFHLFQNPRLRFPASGFRNHQESIRKPVVLVQKPHFLRGAIHASEAFGKFSTELQLSSLMVGRSPKETTESAQGNRPISRNAFTINPCNGERTDLASTVHDGRFSFEKALFVALRGPVW
jgi:hypothetical protein